MLHVLAALRLCVRLRLSGDGFRQALWRLGRMFQVFVDRHTEGADVVGVLPQQAPRMLTPASSSGTTPWTMSSGVSS